MLGRTIKPTNIPTILRPIHAFSLAQVLDGVYAAVGLPLRLPTAQWRALHGDATQTKTKASNNGVVTVAQGSKEVLVASGSTAVGGKNGEVASSDVGVGGVAATGN